MNKLIYLVGIVIVTVFVMQNFPFKETEFSGVLPSGGYCLEKGMNVDYTTTGHGGNYKPIEYCDINKFCTNYEVSTVLKDDEFDQKKLDNFEFSMESSGYSCFQDEAQHTQRNLKFELPENLSVKSKFVCCNNEKVTKLDNCEKNTCGAIYTGKKYKNDCKIYAKQLCKIETKCKPVGDKIVCDPQPFKNGGCKWDVKSDAGISYFDVFEGCGLEAEERCGKTVEYCCDLTCDDKCTASYTYKTGKYVVGCGELKEGTEWQINQTY